MVALRSGILANIRLFGNYTSSARPELPAHPQLQPNDNCPQDAIAAVVQYLFPSPDGIYLAHNEYRNDPIGLMAREAALDPDGPGGLHRLGRLLQAAGGYRNSLVRNSAGSLAPIAGLEAGDGGSHTLADVSRDFRNAVSAILAGTGSRAGYSRGVQFRTVRADFARFLQEALLAEATGQDRRYPPDTVEMALLAYGWRVAGSGRELLAALEGPPPAPEAKARFDPAFFERHFPHFLERLEGKAGAAMAAEEAAHLDWMAVVANLNAAGDPLRIDYEVRGADGDRTLEFNLRGTGLLNLLNLIAHLLPDPLLNRPWPQAPDASRALAAEKLTRLCALLSSPDRRFDWSAGGHKLLETEFPRLVFTVGGQEAFTWRIDFGHFLAMPIQAPAFAGVAAKVAGQAWEPWLDLWVRRYADGAVTPAGVVTEVPLPVRQPPDLFGYQLASEWEAPRVLRGILDLRDPGLAPSFQLIASRALPLDGDSLEKLGRIVQDCPGLAQDPRFYPLRGLLAQPQAVRDQLLRDLVRPLRLTYSAAVAVLLDHGADPRQTSADGDPLVCLAARRRETRVLRKLLASGAPVDARDHLGRTPLAGAMAAYEAVIPSAEIAELLIQAGADLEAVDAEGATPLILAAAAADPEKVQVLLAARAKPNAGDAAGRTPLMHAVLNPDGREVAQALLQAGAELAARDGFGHTALDLARAEGQEAMAAWLHEQATARTDDMNKAAPVPLAAAAAEVKV
jgi:ankyrin repeat protein